MQQEYKVVLTIGGSDSGGGAGIQADIKTFSCLCVHGTSVITAVTAQNTLGVQEVYGLSADQVEAQLKSVLDDFAISFAKTGMLYSETTVESVRKWLSSASIPLVLDPVIEAEAGGMLLTDQAALRMKRDLIPIASVVTPNIYEARALTGIRVCDLDSARAAAVSLVEMGAGAAVVKGGHLGNTDVLVIANEAPYAHYLSGPREVGGNHGVGCTYSAALTACLANSMPLCQAAAFAKSFAADSIAQSRPVGRGVPPVNQSGRILEEARRFRAMRDQGSTLC
jgi:hydroxymethylpyrimidine/phosphomethylpyrimidine kinase